MIGLFDCDLFLPGEFIPNPEIMLLSSYFKSQGEIVHLLLDFNTIHLYSRIFIRKNSRRKTKLVTADIFNRPNVDFGGLFFTDGIYSPLPEEVLACAPDVTIYDRYFRLHPERQSNNLNAHFLSIRRGENIVLKKKVFIIDPDITEKDFEFLDSIQRNRPQQVFHFYYRPRFYNAAGAEKFLSAPWAPSEQKYIFAWELTAKELRKLAPCLTSKSKIDVEAYINNQVRIKNHTQIRDTILRVLNCYFYAVNKGTRLNFIINPQTRKGSLPLLEAFASWTHSYSTGVFYTYISNQPFLKQQCDEIMEEIPSSKILFLTNPFQFTKQGGIWNYGTQ